MNELRAEFGGLPDVGMGLQQLSLRGLELLLQLSVLRSQPPPESSCVSALLSLAGFQPYLLKHRLHGAGSSHCCLLPVDARLQLRLHTVAAN
jgi:hypothetical protein